MTKRDEMLALARRLEGLADTVSVEIARGNMTGAVFAIAHALSDLGAEIRHQAASMEGEG